MQKIPHRLKRSDIERRQSLHREHALLRQASLKPRVNKTLGSYNPNPCLNEFTRERLQLFQLPRSSSPCAVVPTCSVVTQAFE